MPIKLLGELTATGQRKTLDDGNYSFEGFKQYEKEKDVDLLAMTIQAGKDLLEGITKTLPEVAGKHGAKGFTAGATAVAANAAEGVIVAGEDYKFIAKGAARLAGAPFRTEEEELHVRYKHYLENVQRAQEVVKDKKSRLGALARAAGFKDAADMFDDVIEPKA
ncbi:MAG: hypothetical protein COA57_14755, partial [Flavobacteriales bacterium]